MQEEKQQQVEPFLVYPNLQQIMEEQESLLVAISRYQAKLEFYLENLEKIKDWGTETNFLKAKILYEKFLLLVERYYYSYKDMLSRESRNEEENSYISKFFKSLPIPAATKNPHITFDFCARLKTWYSFIEKCITHTEDDILHWNPDEIAAENYDFKMDTFYDIPACKITVHSEKPISLTQDYVRAHSDCYEMMNSFISIAKQKGAELVKSRYVGETSDAIQKEYRPFVKDYISNPKEKNGYQALHACFKKQLDDEGVIFFEVQVNSMLMQQNCEEGGKWCHLRYKENSKILLSLDLDKIMYSDFICSLEKEKYVIKDSAGLWIPKYIVSPKTYRKMV